MIPCFPLKNALKYELKVQSCSMPKYSLLSLALHNSDLFLGNLVEGAALFMLKQPRAYHKWLTEVIFRRVSFSLWLPIVLLTKGVAKHAKCCSVHLNSYISLRKELPYCAYFNHFTMNISPRNMGPCPRWQVCSTCQPMLRFNQGAFKFDG
ncbi:hypothetical protein FA13DRAFT_1500236 [Coprinellus micaceus]|uniref:Uncharacterized protein n=1 Tax=Coprinellus micaceus TaxID=71717 RepID=A0A4Y7TMG7_COPMI|nr:hypothetical protein FA13DRAFT_1500236 [Coprinellus micaceus]